MSSLTEEYLLSLPVDEAVRRAVQYKNESLSIGDRVMTPRKVAGTVSDVDGSKYIVACDDGMMLDITDDALVPIVPRSESMRSRLEERKLTFDEVNQGDTIDINLVDGWIRGSVSRKDYTSLSIVNNDGMETFLKDEILDMILVGAGPITPPVDFTRVSHSVLYPMAYRA